MTEERRPYTLENVGSILKFPYKLTAEEDIMNGLKKALFVVCRHLYDNKVVTAGEGNVSVRIDKERTLIKPTGRYFRTIEPGEFILIDKDGKVLDGHNARPSMETNLHIGVYKNRPDVNAIVHTHPVFAIAYSMNYKAPLDTGVHHKKIPLISFYEPGSKELADETAKALKDSDAVILEYHGVVTVGKNLTEATFLTEIVEKYAEIHWRRNVIFSILRNT